MHDQHRGQAELEQGRGREEGADGEPLGDIFLELRREFHSKHGNPLGLLYSLYCDADTRIQPGLTI